MSMMDLISAIASGSVPSVPSPQAHTERREPPSSAAVPSVPCVPSPKSKGKQRGKVDAPIPQPIHLPPAQWIAEQVPLLPEDRQHIERGMRCVHPRMQSRLADRYVAAWQQGRIAEPRAAKRENAGRRHANLLITRLINGGDAP